MAKKTIEELLQEKRAIEDAIKAEEKRTANYTLAMRMAELLHDRGCTSNHEDYCGWHYENWSGPTRKRYVKAAERVLREWDTIKVSDPRFVDKAVSLIISAARPSICD